MDFDILIKLNYKLTKVISIERVKKQELLNIDVNKENYQTHKNNLQEEIVKLQTIIMRLQKSINNVFNQSYNLEFQTDCELDWKQDGF